MRSGKLLSVVGVFAVVMSSSLTAFAQDAAPAKDPLDKHLNVIFGQKMLDDKDWNTSSLGNLKAQTSFGLEGTYGPGSWPVSIATDFLYSQTSAKSPALGRTVTGSTLELGLGARKVFSFSVPVHPYVGGGLAYGTGTVTCSGCTSKAPSGAGVWLNGGAFYSLNRLNAGLGFRYSSIDGEDGGVKLKVGGLNVNAVVGLGF